MKRRWSILCVVLVTTVTLAGCGGDESPHAPGTVRKLNNVLTQHFDWSIGELAYANKTLYMKIRYYDDPQSLLALDPTDFHTKWRFAGEQPHSQLYLHDVFTDVLFLEDGSSDNLYKLDSATGKVLQRNKLPQDAGGVELITPSTIYTVKWPEDGDGKKTIHALDRENLTERWSFQMKLESRLTEEDGVVYMGGDRVWLEAQQMPENTIYALDAATGRQIWHKKLLGDIHEIVAHGGTLYLPMGRLYALDAGTGQELWQYSKSGIPATPAVGPAGLYFTDDNGVFALDPLTHQENWRFNSDVKGYKSGAVLVGDVLYFDEIADESFLIGVSKKHRIQAVDALSGQGLWSYKMDWEPTGPPLVADGAGYLAEGGGLLYVFK